MRYPSEEIDDNTTFIITDNFSEIARTKSFPDNWIEPLVIIARIEGYKGIDDYVLNLIKERLEMFTDTRDNLDDEFQKYMHNMIVGKDVPNEWAGKEQKEDEEDNDNKKEEEVDEFVKKVNNDEFYNDNNLK